MRWLSVVTAGVLVATLVMVSAPRAAACSCADHTADHKLSYSAAGIVGHVVGRSDHPTIATSVLYEVDVDVWFKEAGPATITVEWSDAPDSCSAGQPFDVGHPLSIAVGKGEHGYTAGGCSDLGDFQRPPTLAPSESALAEVAVIGPFAAGEIGYFDSDGRAIGFAPLPASAGWSRCPGGRLATAASANGTGVHVLDIANGSVETRPHTGEPQGALFATCLSSDGASVVFSACPDTRDRLPSSYAPCDAPRTYFDGSRVSAEGRLAVYDYANGADDGADDGVAPSPASFISEFGTFTFVQSNLDRTAFVAVSIGADGERRLYQSASTSTGTGVTPIETQVDTPAIWVDGQNLFVGHGPDRMLIEAASGAEVATVAGWQGIWPVSMAQVGDRLWGLYDDEMIRVDLTAGSHETIYEPLGLGTYELHAQAQLWPVADIGVVVSQLAPRPPPYIPLEPLAVVETNTETITEPITETMPSSETGSSSDPGVRWGWVMVGAAAAVAGTGAVLACRRRSGL
jgi:hypothetical protein